MESSDHQPLREAARNGVPPAADRCPKPAAPADVEAARQAEKALEQAFAQLQRYRELFDSAPDAYLVTDFLGLIQEANHAAAALLQRPRPFLKGKPLLFLIAPAGRQEYMNLLTQLKRGAASVGDWETTIDVPTGAVVYAAVRAAVILTTEGNPVGVRWILRDVTARKRLEQHLRAEKAFTDSLIEAAQAFIVLLDERGHVVRVNIYLETVSGYRRDELVGRAWPAGLVPAAAAAAQTWFRELLAGRRPRWLLPLTTPAGSRRLVEWSGQLLPRPETAPARLLLVGHDVTDLRDQQRLAAIGQMMAGLTHESRNAIQRSQACLERLTWQLQDRPEALDLVVRAQRAQDDLLRLYEDVRAYAAPVRTEPALCDLAAVWRDAWDRLTDLHAGRDARLQEETDGVDLHCRADRFRLGQVFYNLFDNALAAAADPVRVTVACEPAELGDRPALRVAVRDNGPGLTPEQRRHLFEPFFTTKVKGTGLGLAIVRRIVEAHGGLAAAGEAEGSGAEIIITLPRS